MTRLIALDIAASRLLADEVRRIWDEGNAVLPLDQRMSRAVRHKLARELGADVIVTGDERIDVESPKEPTITLVSGDALVIATSGSTGRPKGVVHTHRGLRAHSVMVTERLGLTAHDHWWLCLPPAHIAGFGVLSRAMYLSSALSFADHVDEDSIARARTAGATHASLVPTLLARHSFEDWKMLLVGAAPAAALPSNAVATYGLTETCGGVVYDGFPMDDVDVRITDGRIHLRTPSIARTYRHAPLTLVDGWFDTGDLGRFVDGRLVIDGRSDDLIITGGNKVWPNLVEQRLREHPLVRDVVVRGVPDAEWGSAVCAWVVPTSQSAPPALDAVRAHVKETLAEYYAPRKLVLLPQIPRSALGKPIVSELPG